MSKQTYTKFITLLQKAATEEDVKAAYAKYFEIEYQTSSRHDLYTPHVFFEFKYEKNFSNSKILATVLAQSLYYIRRLKYVDATRPIPPFICLAERNSLALIETSLWTTLYDADVYDWDLAPSSPDPVLVQALILMQELKNIKIYRIDNSIEFEHIDIKLRKALASQIEIGFDDKKVINENNFEEVFQYWNQLFGDDVRNGLKTSKYFVCDIQEGRSFLRQNQLYFNFDNSNIKVKKIHQKDYENFWQLYQRVSNPDIIRGIIAKIDRLTDETMRRFHGEFFTPLPFAKKALDYIDKVLGSHWWQRGYRLWDMAAGTGNLEYHLPTEAYSSLYLSSLYKEDVEHLERLFPAATCFQYDYLNDDAEHLAQALDNPNTPKLALDSARWKMPDNLRRDLENPDIKWIVLINPPFATAQKAGTNHGDSKKDVSDTSVRKLMHRANLGEASRELFTQFLFRIKHEFAGKVAHLGLFSKLKYIGAKNDQKMREQVFRFAFEKGFIFSISNFVGTTGKFPVGFLIWNLLDSQTLENQVIKVDVFNENVEKIGAKIMRSQHPDSFLSNWIDRPAATQKFPPLGSAITLKADNKDRRDRIAAHFLASFMCKGNEFQNQNFTAFLSAPYVSAGAMSVVPANFEQTHVAHAVRRIPKPDWTNDCDQFLQPNMPLSNEFVVDCVVWNLFSNSNETAAMRNVEYEGVVYQIPNHFFPFLRQDVKSWTIADGDIRLDTTIGQDDRFVASWLSRQVFSEEAAQTLLIAKKLYMFYFENMDKLRLRRFKIETWDAGWWQIRRALDEEDLGGEYLTQLKEKHHALKLKLLPQIYSYGFL